MLMHICLLLLGFQTTKSIATVGGTPGQLEVPLSIDAAYSRFYHACHGTSPTFSTGSRRSYFSLRARRLQMLKVILDRDMSTCCNKDITKFLHKYQIKRSSTSTKASASASKKYDNNKYILLPFRCSPRAASTPPPRRLHTAPTPQ